MLTALLLACQSPASGGAPPATSTLPAEFWPTWGDGNAELASYDLVQPRYGELRTGTATLIYVTEDFSWSARVKADPAPDGSTGQHPASDIRPVMKLNLTREFQTGIYPYHVLTSTFLRIEAGDGMPAWEPIKLTTSVMEWCGSVLERWTPSARKVVVHRDTYFDSDDDQGGNDNAPSTLTVPPGTIYGDALPILVRELGGPWIAPGASLSAPYFPRQVDVRFSHQAPAFAAIVVSRSQAPSPVTTPLGDLPADTFTAAITGGDTLTFTVEAAWPHRLLAWTSTSGEQATLRGVDRLPYWQLNHPGDEVNRARIGL